MIRRGFALLPALLLLAPRLLAGAPAGQALVLLSPTCRRSIRVGPLTRLEGPR